MQIQGWHILIIIVIAILLFGAPKLPGLARSVGQSPVHYDRLASGRPYEPNARYTLRFLDESVAPLYPFGHGLTYAPVQYSAVRLSAPTMAWNGEITATVTLTNSGAREASGRARLG